MCDIKCSYTCTIQLFIRIYILSLYILVKNKLKQVYHNLHFTSSNAYRYPIKTDLTTEIRMFGHFIMKLTR